ncbi:SRPBCC domain-containing protein [Ktedonosporobacter rubrisoli]|uniref:SRPBCC domain-containing protein n=1 Tax=Ktedonosporobacter rubrisoli TaxID=2509675 RepID=A0A4P6K518_KTERU|nr:SRPBCC domain-containing protein [Ktedonosporobacter rubrisoli]QBD83175.1 SRPBCC domain-containing protein [Ktedonosporobacter rubrisoli]
MPEESVSTPTIELLHIELEVPLNFAPERVFRALTQEIDSWWDKKYSTIKQGKVVLEAELGKRMYEDWGNGNGSVFGTVTYLEKDKILEIEGHLGMDKPSQGLLRFELIPQGTATLLKIKHRATGIIRPYAIHVFAQGWKNLFEVCLPAYLEAQAK